MSQKNIIYYVAFPAFIFLLCLFSYQLGFKRGVSHLKKEQISKVLDELEKSETTTEDSKLTYYQELHDDKNPIVEQINSDKNKKPESTTVTTAKTPAPSKSTSPTITVEKPSTGGSTSIQVGAFTDLGKADELIDKLKNSGFDAYTKPVQSKGTELFRVLVRSSKNDVSATQSKLLTQGYSNTFVVTK